MANDKQVRCDHCSCDGSLTFIDSLEMWLCWDCKTEYEDADEVVLEGKNIAIFIDPPTQCDHVWDGEPVEFDDGLGWTSTCSRCGEWAINYSMWHGPRAI